MKNNPELNKPLIAFPLRSRMLVIMVVACTSFQVLAQDSLGTADGSVDWFSGFVGVSENYNDNILDYSSHDIFLLDQHLSSSRFSVDRSFDEITGLKVRLGFSPRVFKQNPTLIRVRYNHSLYSVNTIRNYLTWGVEVRQAFWRKNYVSLEFMILPSYYLRNLSYRDLTLTPRFWLKTVEARLQKKQYSITLGRNFTSRISFSAGYDYAVSEYNRELRERDNTTHRLTVAGGVRLSPLIKFDAGYELATSWAKGRELSDTLTDISYRSHRFSAGATFSFKRILNIPLTFATEIVIESQTYLSEKLYVFPFTTARQHYGDKYHYGRIDHLSMFSSEVSYEVLKSLDVFVQYSWEQNITNLEESLDSGSYQTHQFGGGVEYSF